MRMLYWWTTNSMTRQICVKCCATNQMILVCSTLHFGSNVILQSKISFESLQIILNLLGQQLRSIACCSNQFWFFYNTGYYRVFIKYCVFFEYLKYSVLLPFSVFPRWQCVHTRQVEHQRCSRTGRVQKIYKILRKITIFNEHPVPYIVE